MLVHPPAAATYRPGDNGWGERTSGDARVVGRHHQGLSAVAGAATTASPIGYSPRLNGNTLSAGRITPFYFGSDEKDLCNYANVANRVGKEIYADWKIAGLSGRLHQMAPVLAPSSQMHSDFTHARQRLGVGAGLLERDL